MPVKMRFRSDPLEFASYKAAGITPDKLNDFGGFSPGEIEAYERFEPAQPGDTWRIRWYQEGGGGPVAGYAICCPRCRKIHHWSIATNCSGQKTAHQYTDSKGQARIYETCEHSGKASCWDWTGSAEEGTLTARPSLHCTAPDCGWHGWLTDGVLKEC